MLYVKKKQQQQYKQNGEDRHASIMHHDDHEYVRGFGYCTGCVPQTVWVVHCAIMMVLFFTGRRRVLVYWYGR